ncbi:DUF305 domain-containing protein [Mucilaginibacter sp. X4EP1]|uniref:DUF305 domain-containing protein n=1 Tax=Mucilaginibacter sp. X4EP1 TaxID=2723092 RepID=UPI002167A067|nr:DUF305 domain-containing protein [Mucilaginibacter sp. X4EP1]MCS3813449.1 uncharacterized protein (DUF305 family) [Mucilaginibacter sp. X4EP1]
MKNKPIFILLGIVLVNALSAHAQSMSMQMPGMPKSQYLLMMDTMMNKMADVPEPVSVESDFNRQMIAHHEGAVDMARYEIGHGKDFSMIQLAKSILAEQLVEIQQMDLWLKQSSGKKIIPAGYKRDMPLTMSEMMNAMPADSNLSDPDRAFAMVMIPHHRAAIAMARVMLNYSDDQQTIRFSKQLISDEEIEIEQMSAFLK